MKVINYFKVCQDCLYFIAYGQHPGDLEDDSSDDARDEFVSEHSNLVPYSNDGLAPTEFSELDCADESGSFGFMRQSCECCGQGAGEKYAVVQLGK